METNLSTPDWNYTWETQRIGLDSVVNARELGGYVMQDGRRIKRGLLLRGGGLAKASETDLKRLEDNFKVSYIFDFRTEGEVVHAPDKELNGARHIWLPTIDPNTEKLGTTNLPPPAYRVLPQYLVAHYEEEMVQRVARGMYIEMLANEYTQLQYASFLQMILQNEGGAVYWHCSQGKDRTGLGAMLLLSALGADRRTIVNDFAITNTYYAQELKLALDMMEARDGGERGRDVVVAFIGAHIGYFENMLDFIDREFGSLLSYVRNQLLLSDGDLENLRNKYLEN